MPALLVDRDRRGWESRVREGPNGNFDHLFITFFDVEDRRSASRAEGKPEPRASVSDPNELRAFTLDSRSLARKGRLRTKDAAGSSLASVAVADGDPDGISTDFRSEPTATARCKPNRHNHSNGVVGVVELWGCDLKPPGLRARTRIWWRLATDSSRRPQSCSLKVQRLSGLRVIGLPIVACLARPPLASSRTAPGYSWLRPCSSVVAPVTSVAIPDASLMRERRARGSGRGGLPSPRRYP
jgi:hypothetical protein